MSRGLNKVMVIGRTGKTPEMRFTPSGVPVVNFSVACDRSWKSADGQKHTETEWFSVVAWDSLAELAKNFLEKGSLVYVEGRLQSRTWQDNEGHNQRSIEIVARDLILLTQIKHDEMNDSDEVEELLF